MAEQARLHSGDVVAINVGFQVDHVGGGPSVHEALVQHVVHSLQLPFPAGTGS